MPLTLISLLLENIFFEQVKHAFYKTLSSTELLEGVQYVIVITLNCQLSFQLRICRI